MARATPHGMRPVLRSIRRRIATVVVVAALSACGAQGEGTTDAPTGGEVAQAPDEAAVEALEGLELTPHQRGEVERMRSELKVAFGPAEVARDTFVAEVLRQLGDGAIDTDALESKRRNLVAALDQAKPEVIQAADDLHALLTSAQRRTLVEGIEQRAGSKPRDRGALARELDLSWDQKRRLFSASRQTAAFDRSKRDRLEEQLDEAKAAFVSDQFDAAKLALARDPVADEWTATISAAVVVFTPVLEPEQRSTLARRLEQQL